MAKESGQSMLDIIKQKMQNAGRNFGDMFGLGDGKKSKGRFLSDFEDAIKVNMHDKWQEFMPTPCLKHVGKKCPYCERDDVRTREHFCWTWYEYETNKKLLFMFPAQENTPLPDMISALETYGTLCDRDFVVSRKGTRQDTSYKVMPLDKGKFKGKDDEPYTEDEIFEKLLEMANVKETEDDDDDEKDKKKGKDKGKNDKGKDKDKKSGKNGKKKQEEDDDPHGLDDMDLDELIEFADDNDIDIDDMPKADRKKENKVRKFIKEQLDDNDD
jgi:hypothetical protein